MKADRDFSQALDPLSRFASALGTSTPEEAMRFSCRRLLEETEPDRKLIPLPRLQDALGARREDIPLPTEGRLRIDEKGYLIHVRERTHWRRARFTVAHELGHILLCEGLRADPAALKALREEKSWDQVERLCNVAAAELLMPADDFLSQVDKKTLEPDKLESLRDRYGVSWTALAIRCNELLGSAVSFWKRHQRHPGERITFRVTRSWGSGSGWLPIGLTTRYLQPDVISKAAVDGSAAEHGVVAFGGRSTDVFATAIALGDRSSSPASFDQIDGISPRQPSDKQVLLFLDPVETPKELSDPQQLALLT